ncbi:MAG TPA: hypothetical protein VL172_14350 [Kofleriaceae bacterium]|nr:hypothetical protein [Kofleriaceae bacterium]
MALGIGGTMLLASLVFGGNDHGSAGGHDVDHGADHDHGADKAGGAMVLASDQSMVKHEGAADAALSILPVTSLRFWTFFMAFFGLTGLTLTAAALGAGVVINALLSTGVGYLSGMSVVTLGRRLQRASTDSSVGAADYVGATATVSLPVAKGRTGKIRLDIKGRIVELIADTEDEPGYQAKQLVMIYQMTADGRALITRPDQGEAA